MNYIVTGGAGFIGSHLIERLISEKHWVLCIDNLSSGYISNLPEHKNITIIQKAVQYVRFEQIPKIDGIFHLAAQASVPKSIDDFYNSSANNLLSTLKVWDWANKLKIPIVYATSSAVYGNLPIGDDTIDDYDILSPYAQDKLTMEYYSQMAYKIYKTKAIGLRFFNVYGPRQDPTNPYSGVISIFIDRLIKGLAVTVNGGYQTRDFIYVNDIVNVIIQSMKKLHNESLCETINVGTGVSISIDKLLESLISIFNIEPEIIKVGLPKGDPEKSDGTYKKLEQLLNVNIEQFTAFNQGLKETVNYFLK